MSLENSGRVAKKHNGTSHQNVMCLRPRSKDENFLHNNAQHLLSRKGLDHLTILFRHVVCCGVKFARNQKCLDNKHCMTEHFFCFSDTVCCSFPLTAPQTLLGSSVCSDILISCPQMITPLFLLDSVFQDLVSRWPGGL